ncbi:tryptophan-rich sensory protein [Bradyrhizobium arachidis]|uniref:TspO/MBR family protein n=1 Tax=Bradyrhizobium TaxID=374 RepID=UPI00188DC539|nr:MULTISPECIES: TspO/MBR family protein [Bradyrhizobium]MDN4987720.1 TspO/MBR family protein [Bradyrhizobium sp. WYCCWR 13022]QOZ54214.1 tryptophan-rich sensory protein [Bradyrhizobium sp. CCBAU 53338]UVO34842.1 tryptophan-rich sensory protein [Bradyrhizobium arachidis]
MRTSFTTHVIFVLIVLGAGFAIGSTNLPGPWYAGLIKPPFNPPNWVFAPVWSVVYLLIALAGARTWGQSPYGVAMLLWAAQMLLNFAWSPVFFTWHRTGLALGIIVAMLLAIIGFIVECWLTDRTAAWLFVPYLAWVAFATLLNASIVMLN